MRQENFLEQKMKKRLGVMTSGGDCPGLNAVINAIVRHGDQLGWEVLGIKKGTEGLLHPEGNILLTPASLSSFILEEGGTILGSNSSKNPFYYPRGDHLFVDCSQDVVKGLQQCQLDGLISIGGEGSLGIMSALMSQYDLKFIGIPKTIDNDVPMSAYSVGFYTAVEEAAEALMSLKVTGKSHERIMILEVMGRNAGHIALHAGIAGGADFILVPEIPYQTEVLVEQVRRWYPDKKSLCIIVCEGINFRKEKYQLNSSISQFLADVIQTETNIETRHMVLGHLQRGARPRAFDRLIAAAFGTYAVDLLHRGTFNRVLLWQNDQVVDAPFEAINHQCGFIDSQKNQWLQTARRLNISFADQLI